MEEIGYFSNKKRMNHTIQISFQNLQLPQITKLDTVNTKHKVSNFEQGLKYEGVFDKN